ncbi:MAG TPA: hypothetical protein VG892_09715, partial [Terriglobales bacterium]|nr:hypothetical protein [Terriglobales bacterium]
MIPRFFRCLDASRTVGLPVLLTAFLASGAFAAQAPLALTLDTAHLGSAIPDDFSGLSFEVALVMPATNGVRYFRPDNLPLLRLFQTLGIRNLRIGGNTSDRDARQLPGEADLDSLFAFAEAAHTKVIYCLRLRNGDPQENAHVAHYLISHYGSLVDCLSIGQEPSAYPVEKVDKRPAGERMGTAAEKFRYETYRDEWRRFADAIIAGEPGVRLCGPSVHNNGTWARRFMEDFGHSNHVVLVTEHLYPGGAGGKVPSPEIGRDRMLANDFVRAYQKLYDSFVPVALSNGLPYRLEEVNNYFNGGAADVSNTYASALWGLDFMWWWAAHHAAGVNFHTGDRVAAGPNLRPSRYTAFFSATNGYEIRPLSYGLKAFSLGSAGRMAALSLPSEAPATLSAYAVLGDDGSALITLINKAHGTEAVSYAV